MRDPLAMHIINEQCPDTGIPVVISIVYDPEDLNSTMSVAAEAQEYDEEDRELYNLTNAWCSMVTSTYPYGYDEVHSALTWAGLPSHEIPTRSQLRREED